MEGADALTQISAEPPDQGAPEPTRVNGQRVGRYHLAFEVAAGGMATVYLAALRGPAGFDKVFALKRIHSHLAKKKSYVEMFLDEARLAARIQHPNVCGVVDFGEEDGEYFLAMEYMLGVPLSRVLTVLAQRRDRPPERWPAIASRLIQDACEGLHAAHELAAPDGTSLGVVHRDVSPQNLFVGFDGVLKVVDFGIAKAKDKASVTRTLELKGKVAYMAPEQIRKGEVDRRADVFGLAVVMWEMLTLKRLFRRSSQVDTMYAVLESDLLPPSEANDAVPPELDPVLMKALAREASDRTPDARTFGREIGRLWGRILAEPVDRAEIAQLMGVLFAGEEAEQRELIELARRTELPPVERQSVPHEDESFSDGQTALARPSARKREKEPSRKKVWIPIAVATLALLLVGGGLFVAVGSEPERGTSTARTELEAVTPVRTTAPDEASSDVAEGEAGPATQAAVEIAEDVEMEAPEETSSAAAARRSPMRRRATMMSMSPMVQLAPAGEAPEEEPPPTGPGTLVVVVPGGWANVYEAGSGRLLGATPLTEQLSPGRHRLELRFGGQPPPVPVTVEITAAETTRLTRRAP